MYIKVHGKPSGIPAGRVAIAPGKTDLGAAQVTALWSALDAHEMSSVVFSARLSVAEAREIAARLIAAANAAEAF